MFVLRFNNGLVSAGPVWDGTRRRPDETVSAEAEWASLLRLYPSLEEQFAAARPVRPFVRTGRLQRRARRVVGPGWALLPHAAYFLDPLFSGGNAHTLLGVERLGRIFREHWGRPSLEAALAEYERMLFREVAFLDRLIHGSYTAFRRFELMAAYTMYYFAGAIHSEGRRRRGEAGPGDEFLFSHDPTFRRRSMAGARGIGAALPGARRARRGEVPAANGPRHRRLQPGGVVRPGEEKPVSVRVTGNASARTLQLRRPCSFPPGALP